MQLEITLEWIDNMKPRYEPRDEEYDSLLKEAKELEERFTKAVPDYANQKEGSTQGVERFETQPGKVPNVFYNTNNVIPEVEDVKNAGATSEKSNILDKPTQYPDAMDDTGYRINEKGGSTPIQKSLGGSEEKLNLQDIRKSAQRLDRHFN